MNYNRFSDDIVITVSGHGSKRGWAPSALERLEEELKPLGVRLNRDKTRMVNTLQGKAFGFLGLDLRRVQKKAGNGYFILMTPQKKARQAGKAMIRDIIGHSGATAAKEVMSKIKEVLTGWVNYFRVGNSSRAFSEVRDYLEMKVRALLTRCQRRHKRSIGWPRGAAGEGCYLWQQERLEPPQEVIDATQTYRDEMDVLGGFLAERCILEPELSALASDLYKAYTEWSEENGGKRPLSQRAFGMALTERRIEKVRAAHFVVPCRPKTGM